MLVIDKIKLINKNQRLNQKIRNYRKLFKYIENCIALFVLIIGRYLYIKSLKGCLGTEFSCINFAIDDIVEDIYYCIRSALFFLLFLFLLQVKFCSYYFCILFILIMIELIIKDHGETLQNHGSLNFEALILILFFGEFIILIILLIFNNIKKKRHFINIFIISIILSIYSVIFTNYKDQYYCKNWSKGINNTYILNDPSEYPCLIMIPKRCLINIITPYLDFSKILKIKCENRKEKEKYLLKEISNLKNSTKKINRIGFPITIGDKDEIEGKPLMYAESLLKFVKNNLIDIDSIEESNNSTKNNKIPEVIVDFSKNPYGELKIKINKNENLSKKRKLQSSKNNIHSNNILFIFFDNLSRIKFYRQYPKTLKFIEKFFTYKGFSTKSNKNQKYHGFEFLKYHKFNGATLGNVIPMFNGVYYEKNNKIVSIVKDLKNSGYITCNVQDICHKELMDIGDEFTNYTYIEFDHEYASPNCDPNVYIYGYGLFSGENGVLKKCLYGKESIEHSLEYARKFWLAYKENKRFLRIVNTYEHDYIGEKSKYSDYPLYQFLYNLYSDNELKDTTVFLAADHGFVLTGFYEIFNTDDYKIQFSLPVFILLVPDIENKTYEEQYSEIKKNQQTFITPFDIYYTIRYIIYNEKYKNLPLNGNKDDGESLFKYIDPKTRLCSKYKEMSNLNCRCRNISEFIKNKNKLK